VTKNKIRTETTLHRRFGLSHSLWRCQVKQAV